MPNLRNRVAVPLGILLALAMVITIYFLENLEIQFLVSSTYVGLVTPPNQFFEVAWLLATLDQVLNLTLLSSLLLWCGIVLVSVFVHQQVTNALKMMISAISIPGGAWLLFIIKFAPFAQFHPLLLWTFIIWRLLVPLALLLGSAGLLSMPFWFLSHKHAPVIESSHRIRFVCSQCGTEYRSKPLVCAHCGNKQITHEHD